MKHIQHLLLTFLGLLCLTFTPALADPAPAPVITPVITPATPSTATINQTQPANPTAPTGSATDAPVTAQPSYSAPTPSNPYEITGIAVDITADSALRARDQALTTAQRSGLQQLMDHLNADKNAVDKLSDNDIATLVQHFAVEDQHTSAVRYFGHYTVQYRQNAVHSWLNKKGLTYTEPGAAPTPGAAAATPADTQTTPPIHDVLTVVAMPDTQPTSHLYANVAISSIQQWAQIQSRLNNISVIKQVNVLNLTKTGSHVDIEFKGDLENLRTIFGQNRLQLTQPSPGTEWVLQFI